MPMYYPSLVVSLRIRFDKYFNIVPEKTMQSFNTVEDLILQPEDEVKKILEPLVTAETQSKDSFSHLVYVMPMSASVEIPGYRQAGKFSLSFRWRELPIDPRLIRACGVEIHLGSVTPSDFATGMMKKEANWTRKSIINIRDSLDVIRKDTVVMVGTVDSWSVDYDDSGGTVNLEGRDIRGLLLDMKTGPEIFKNIDVNQDIKSVVEQVLASHPLLGPANSANGSLRVRVEANPELFPGGRLPLVFDDDLTTRVNKKARVAARKGKITTTEKTKVSTKAPKPKTGAQPDGDKDRLGYWDIIVHYCYLVGVIPIVVGETIVLKPVRNVYDTRVNAGTNPKEPTVFQDGRPRVVVLSDGRQEEIRFRRMVYGRDVKTLKFERKIGGVKAQPIKLVSVDTSSNERGADRMISVFHPPEAEPKNKRTTGESADGSASSGNPLIIHMTGVKSKERLAQIAEAIFEEIGHSEIGGSCETRALCSFGGDNSDPDLLRLRPGDPVQFLTDTRTLSSRAPLVSELTDWSRMGFDEAVKTTAERLGNSSGDLQLARAIVAASRGMVFELSSFFRVHTVKYDWKAESGVSISFDFHNFIEVRSQDRSTIDLPVTPSSKAPLKKG